MAIFKFIRFIFHKTDKSLDLCAELNVLRYEKKIYPFNAVQVSRDGAAVFGSVL